MKVICVRHGESEKNVRHIVNANPSAHLPLTRKGKEQARRVAREIAHEGVQCVVSSLLPRALETAGIIARALGVVLLEDGRLNEINNGVYEGRSQQEYVNAIGGALDNRHHMTPEEGESFDALKERVLSCLLDFKWEGFEAIAIVTHGHPAEAAIRCAHEISYDVHVDLPEKCGIVNLEI